MVARGRHLGKGCMFAIHRSTPPPRTRTNPRATFHSPPSSTTSTSPHCFFAKPPPLTCAQHTTSEWSAIWTGSLRALYEAGEKRKGTDLSIFIDILTTRSAPQLRKVFERYSKYCKVCIDCYVTSFTQ
ncbi:hypothetical protein SKAU_G00014790 [Synaphobranchus kaupii]|uniref:Annexin n=1 Tax=Synaphobranchus kaupii TaxID=118154 RepID=A0A9Q1GAP5_SYNKA|nr:hypothetical protein SKAU_G00014790 [Synaphobranchus kaupii]